MSRVDTTSFAEILTRSLGQGANMAANAASLQQRQKEAAAQQAMQQQQFDANEAQRAFGNDLATQRLGLDQLQFQTMTDRIAREQAMEQEDRMMGGALLASSGIGDGYLRLSALQNGGTPAPDDVLRVRKWSEQGISTRALTTLRDAVQKGADLREIKAKTERLGAIVDNMMADPKNEKARPALELIKEMTLDPQTQGTAIREAFGVIQQQQAAQQAAAEQAQRVGLVGAMRSGQPLTPEQELAVRGDPALRGVYADVNQPAAPDPQVVAQLFARLQQGDTAARAQLIQMGQLTPSAAYGGQQTDRLPALRSMVEDRQREYQFALEQAKAVGLFTKEESKGAFPVLNTKNLPVDPSDPKRQAYDALVRSQQSLQTAMEQLRVGGMPQQSGPMLLSELDAQRGMAPMQDRAMTLKTVRQRVESQLGRRLTDSPQDRELLKQAMKQAESPRQ